MKFLFCGNNSSPEWFLAESAVLTKITAVKMKLVSQYIIVGIIDKDDQSGKIFKLLEGSGFTPVEINSTISCINFVVENSAKYDISDQVLVKELIDLGLPKGSFLNFLKFIIQENCEYLGKVFKQYKGQLQEAYTAKIMKIGSFINIQPAISQFIVSDNLAPQTAIQSNKFIDTLITTENIDGQQIQEQFIMFPDKMLELYQDLYRAQQIMNKY